MNINYAIDYTPFTLEQEQLADYCQQKLEETDEYVVTRHKKFVLGEPLAEKTVDICLVAHLDVVHKRVPTWDELFLSPENFLFAHDGKHQIGLGADDKAGVVAILELVRLGYRPYVLFCYDEETGGSGASAAAKWMKANKLELRYFVELDRKGSTEAVYYDCGNDAFKVFIKNTIGYKSDYGSFSDISMLCPVLNVAGVNLSIGYHHAHSSTEYLEIAAMENTICKVVTLLEHDYSELQWFDYQEVKVAYYDYDYDYGYNYNGLYSTTSARSYKYEPKFLIDEWDIRLALRALGYDDEETLRMAVGWCKEERNKDYLVAVLAETIDDIMASIPYEDEEDIDDYADTGTEAGNIIPFKA